MNPTYPLALLAGLFAYLGSSFARRFSDRLHVILAFSGGAVLGVAFFHLLPEASELLGDLRMPLLLAAGGFAAILTGDQLFSLHEHADCDNPRHGGEFSAMAMLLHGLVDGLAVALGFLASPAIGAGMAVAILAHKFSDGVAISASVMRMPKKRQWIWVGLNAAMPILGATLGLWFAPSTVVLGYVLSVFAGMFLYVGAGDLINEAHHEHPGVVTTLATVAGMAAIFGLSRLLP